MRARYSFAVGSWTGLYSLSIMSAMASPSHCSCCPVKMLGWVEARTAGGGPQDAVWAEADAWITEHTKSTATRRETEWVIRGRLSRSAEAYHWRECRLKEKAVALCAMPTHSGKAVMNGAP